MELIRKSCNIGYIHDGHISALALVDEHGNRERVVWLCGGTELKNYPPPVLPPCDSRCGPDAHVEGCHQQPEPPPSPSVVKLTQREFDALPDYSASLPTGQTIGKQWKRRNDYYDETKGWRRGEYVEHADPGLIGIEWRDIVVVTPPEGGG